MTQTIEKRTIRRTYRTRRWIGGRTSTDVLMTFGSPTTSRIQYHRYNCCYGSKFDSWQQCGAMADRTIYCRPPPNGKGVKVQLSPVPPEERWEQTALGEESPAVLCPLYLLASPNRFSHFPGAFESIHRSRDQNTPFLGVACRRVLCRGYRNRLIGPT